MGTGEEPPARRENGGRRRRWMDGDDDEEYVAEEEEEDFADELSASSAGEEGEDSDAEYQEDEEEETPRPVKGGARGQKGKKDPAAMRRRYDVDDDYEEDPSGDEGDLDEGVEYLEETPLPKQLAKGGTSGRKGKMDPAPVRARRHRYEVDDDSEDELYESEEETGGDEEVEEYHEEIEEEEEAPPRPKSVAKSAGCGQNVEPARSHRRKYEEDMDFEPELDDDEDEVDEDIDFDPEVGDEDEYAFEDEEDEEFSAARARKVTVKNPAKRKSLSKRQSLKKKKANKRSKSSKRKTSSAKSKKSARVRRVRKRFVVDGSDEDSEDDDFIMDELDQHPRKKARTGTSKQTELEHPPVGEEGTWPNLESETSEFEFVTSDDEPDDAETATVEASTVRKGRKKRKSGSESSSDSEFVVSDKELENLGETEPPKVQPVLLPPIRKNSITRHGEDKGKKKEDLEEAGNPICGICLSEDQRATVQGVLNCCSHYFCFACIMEWSRVESRCPLCKQRFTTITKSSKADLGLGVRKAIIKVEERDQVYQPTEEEIRRWLDPYENVVCIECNQGGDDSLMLLCDICDSSAHTYCVGLGREVPEGNWYCGGCRLNDEGSSHGRTPHAAGYERQIYRNHVGFGSVGFGVAAQNGTCDRSSSINRRRSFQGIDLNLSPREVPGEIHPADSQASTDSVSTPGRRQTVSGRRQIHRYIRILLTQPRQTLHNGTVPRTELNDHSFRSSSEASTSQIPDGIQQQRNGLPFAPSMPLDDDFHHIDGVKSNLRNMH